MTYPVNEIESFFKNGGKYHGHNLYGYDVLNTKNTKIDWLSPNFNNPKLKFIAKKTGLGNNFMRLALQIDCINKSKNYDVIYSPHDLHLLPLAILRYLRICKTPIYMICHFSYNLSFVENKYKRLFKKIERYFVFKGIDKISFANDYTLHLALKDFNVPEKHQSVVNWGANISYFENNFDYLKINPETPYFAAMGSANRDYSTLIKAFTGIKSNLNIFSKLNKDNFPELDIPNNVDFINLYKYGLESMNHLKEYYSKSVAVLIPVLQNSDVPNGATVLVEALASGKPLIVTDFESNYIDVEKEKIGIKVKKGDIKGWANAINWLLDNPNEAKDMGERSKKLATEKYNYLSFTKKILDNLHELI
jgi:glycosyltransferase involved in cell wall biosynthesis